MTKFIIAGASGSLGGHIIRKLLEQVPASDLILTTRSPDKLSALADMGASVRHGDYRDRDLLEQAFAGGNRLMLISGLDVTHRVQEHRNAIEAAKKVGVEHILYTSTCGIHPQNPTPSASDHIVTEDDLRRSGIGYTVFRNACYAEVFPTIASEPARQTGEWKQATGEGKLAPVCKLDIARCADVVLRNPAGHNGAIYEISGPELLTFRDIAAITSQIYDVPIEYIPISADEKFAMLDAMGVPRTYSEDNPEHEYAQNWCSEEMVNADLCWARGFHEILTGHVEMITGQKPMPLREVFELYKGKDYAEC